ncbi:MAG: DnaB helicase C-terminal domain-containing protein [Acidimicrobiia bacterium]|nr:DnaB helicase C-terminal domain-containing protein [Acidimicrobiia bacterium]
MESPRPLERLDELLEQSVLEQLTSPAPSMATGFDPLDDVLEGGFRPEELVVLGGRPGVGKTIALVQWSRHMAQQGTDVILAHYEHSELALIGQMLLIEIGEKVANSSMTIEARGAVSEMLAGRKQWSEVVVDNEMLSEAADEIRRYAPHLQVLTANGLRGGMQALVDAVEANRDASVLVVDHLHKVDPHRAEAAVVIEELKGLAVELGITVLAAAMIDNGAIDARRLRMAHLEAAAPVGHEADLVLMLNDKLPAVSRAHSAYDSLRADSFRNQVLLSIEKNRRGLAGVDLEFNRDYAHRRVDPRGAFVSELLVDDVLVRE